MNGKNIIFNILHQKKTKHKQTWLYTLSSYKCDKTYGI